MGFVGGGASVGFGEDGKVVSFGENEVGVGSVGRGAGVGFGDGGGASVMSSGCGDFDKP